MRSFLKWYRQNKSLPYSNYLWSRLLGESKKKWLITHQCLCFANGETVNEFSDGNEEFQLRNVCGHWYAIGEECEFELTSKDVLKLELNRRGFAEAISHCLNPNNTVSNSPYSDGVFYLGTIAARADFRVFLLFDSYKAVIAMSDWYGGQKPLVIALGNITGDVQDFVSKHQGECISFEDCISLAENGFKVIGKWKKLIEQPRIMRRKDGYYSWKSAVGREPEIRTLAKLSMEFINANEVLIKFGEDSMRFSYCDVSIFRNDNTKEVNSYWKILYKLANNRLHLNDSDENTIRVSLKRLNKDFREFFNMSKSQTALSYKDGNIIVNFRLISRDEQHRSHSEVFVEVGDEIKSTEDFNYPDI